MVFRVTTTFQLQINFHAETSNHGVDLNIRNDNESNRTTKQKNKLHSDKAGLIKVLEIVSNFQAKPETRRLIKYQRFVVENWTAVFACGSSSDTELITTLTFIHICGALLRGNMNFLRPSSFKSFFLSLQLTFFLYVITGRKLFLQRNF